VKLELHVHFSDDYPDVLPDLTLSPLEGEVDESEMVHLLDELKKVVGYQVIYFQLGNRIRYCSGQ